MRDAAANQWMILCGLTVMAITGCAGLPPGKAAATADSVAMHFTCVQADGAVAATSRESVTRADTPAKSSLFRERSTFEPVRTSVPENAAAGAPPQGRGFEGEIIHRLAEAAKGMRAGERKRIVFADPAATVSDGFVRVARVRQRPKELRVTVEEYLLRTGKSPEAGHGYTVDPALPGRIVAVTDGEVHIRFHAQPGTTVATPFGPGMIKETENAYLVDIDAMAGSPVRSGPLAGRIVRVDEDFIVIDYGQPLGGQELNCDMEVISVERSDRDAEAGVSPQE